MPQGHRAIVLFYCSIDLHPEAHQHHAAGAWNLRRLGKGVFMRQHCIGKIIAISSFWISAFLLDFHFQLTQEAMFCSKNVWVLSIRFLPGCSDIMLKCKSGICFWVIWLVLCYIIPFFLISLPHLLFCSLHAVSLQTSALIHLKNCFFVFMLPLCLEGFGIVLVLGYSLHLFMDFVCFSVTRLSLSLVFASGSVLFVSFCQFVFLLSSLPSRASHFASTMPVLELRCQS